ncbi:MAG: hypothetical protein U0528_06930 [Anaerolineae bacterium]
MRRSLFFVIAMLAIALAFSACGGGTNPTPDPIQDAGTGGGVAPLAWDKDPNIVIFRVDRQVLK